MSDGDIIRLNRMYKCALQKNTLSQVPQTGKFDLIVDDDIDNEVSDEVNDDFSDESR